MKISSSGSLRSAALFLLIFMLGCSKKPDVEVIEPFFSFRGISLALRTGEKSTVELNEEMTNYAFEEISYRSMDDRIATVVDGRTIQSFAPGNTTIVAMHGKKELDRFKVNVVDGVVTAISIVPATATLKEGLSLQLNPVLTPTVAIDKTVKWSSSDVTIANVSQDAKITAIRAGDVVISGTTATNLTVKCLVKVIP